MKRKLLQLLLLFPAIAFAQGLSLKPGDKFPAIPIAQLQNSPQKSLDIQKAENKYYILNFWGTWCSPCIPEMDALAKLQKANASRIQVVAISDDSPAKLQNYLKTKPSTIWLATDTTFLLYGLFNFSSVSHAAIVDKDKNIVALMKTHSITQGLLDSLYRGNKIVSDANLKEKPVNTSADIFAVDSTLSSSFTVRGYMIGQQAMGRRYTGTSPYTNRRISFVNSGITTIYKTAYDIVSQDQVIYEVDEKKLNNYEDRTQQYCIDLLVKPEEKDSLYAILRQRLNATLPVKAKIIYKTIPVYVISDNGFKLPESTDAFSYGFSGRGYDGKGVTIEAFANDYLSNELDLPVVDETGLRSRHNIQTNLDTRTMANVKASVEALGLKITKAERRMRMLVLY